MRIDLLHLVSAFAVVATASTALAQSLPAAAPIDAWGPNGDITAFARSGDTLYVGGRFDYVGPPTGALALFGAATGSPLGASSVSGRIDLVTPVPGGGWIAAGSFFVAGDPVPQRQLAKFDANGVLVPSWFATVDGSLSFVQVEGNAVYLGGFIVGVNLTPRNGLAAVDLASGALLPWNPIVRLAGFSPSIADGLVHQGVVFIRGQFSDVGGQPVNNFAGIDAVTGALRAASAAPVESVQTMAAAGGTVFVTGYDTTGTQRGARVLAATGAIASWNVPSFLFISALAATGTRVIAASGSTSLAALDPVTGVLIGAPVSPGGVLLRLTAGASQIYVSRLTFTSSTPVDDVLALPADALGAPAWTIVAGGIVADVAEDASGRLAVVGSFQSAGGSTRTALYAVDLRTGRPTAFAPALDGGVRSLTTVGNIVVAGGTFRFGNQSSGLVAFDGTTGQRLPWSPVGARQVEALANDGRTLFAGGDFAVVDGVSRPFLVSISLATGRVTDWLPVPDGPVGSLATTADGALLVAGRFSALAAAARGGGAAFSTDGYALRSWNPDVDSTATAVASAAGRIALVGSFSRVQGQPSTGFAIFDSAGVRLPIRPPARFFSVLRAVAGLGSSVMLAGSAGSGASPLAIVSAVTGADLGWAPTLADGLNTGFVDRVAWYSDVAVVGGRFSLAAGVPVSNLAIFRSAGPMPPSRVRARLVGSALTMSWEPAPGSTPSGYVLDAVSGGVGGPSIGSFPLSGASFAATVPNGTYTLRLRSVEGGVAGSTASVSVTITVPAPAQAPPAPSGLIASAAPSSVTLAWKAGNGAGNLESYVIEAGSFPGLSNIGALDTGVVDPNFMTAAPPGTYYVRVRARNAFGLSAPSNEVVIVVP